MRLIDLSVGRKGVEYSRVFAGSPRASGFDHASWKLFQGVGFRLSGLKESRSSLFRDLERLGARPGTAWMLEVPRPVPRELVRGPGFANG